MACELYPNKIVIFKKRRGVSNKRQYRRELKVQKESLGMPIRRIVKEMPLKWRNRETYGSVSHHQVHRSEVRNLEVRCWRKMAERKNHRQFWGRGARIQGQESLEASFVFWGGRRPQLRRRGAVVKAWGSSIYNGKVRKDTGRGPRQEL